MRMRCSILLMFPGIVPVKSPSQNHHGRNWRGFLMVELLMCATEVDLELGRFCVQFHRGFDVAFSHA